MRVMERKGEGNGGHALSAEGDTRRARGRRFSHSPASKGNLRGRHRQPAGASPAGPHAPPSLRAGSRHLTWMAFPHRLWGEEERALLDERLVETVELPVHVGVGEWRRVTLTLRKEKREQWGDDCETRKQNAELKSGRTVRSEPGCGRRGAVFIHSARAPGAWARPPTLRACAWLAPGEGRCARGARAEPLCGAARGRRGWAPLRRTFSCHKRS